ncbi:hypothetical protein LH128_06607 [Sphingomonas sp. LH128]|uniref:Uncharacterized protein n=1 Tax=Novosphingobium resinovorum TaxID=158500 RepID=A0A1D8AFG2_9SPHN|nr:MULTISPECIES: hypothetical protein [Sphingomonadaceae]AOR80856.1 hypothetical protein BES08_29095 [Novosphingobium resinovorum]EJU13846.1 hypothetical protein LH128_06607 [Sphingomonas sp. LH128]
MASISKTQRLILIAAFAALLIALAMHRLEGPFTGDWITVVLSASLFGLAFMWDGIASYLKR